MATRAIREIIQPTRSTTLEHHRQPGLRHSCIPARLVQRPLHFPRRCSKRSGLQGPNAPLLRPSRKDSSTVPITYSASTSSREFQRLCSDLLELASLPLHGISPHIAEGRASMTSQIVSQSSRHAALLPPVSSAFNMASRIMQRIMRRKVLNLSLSFHPHRSVLHSKCFHASVASVMLEVLSRLKRYCFAADTPCRLKSRNH